jgi:predicted amidohydrolase YtcJ
MLYAYTIQSAKALRMEQQIGSIKVGKMADLIILDHDIMATPVESLRDVRVVKTILGGKGVFQQ